jgi:ubiquinone/menaquinone biosynthesis C-methylase UbiE
MENDGTVPIFSCEKEKYYNLYSNEIGTYGENYTATHGEGFGRGFWGAGVISLLKGIKPHSLLDVGCGYGKFCDAVSTFVPRVIGADIASVITNNVLQNPNITFIDCEAKKIPLNTNGVEWITSFDCLEHCLEVDVDTILSEFNRVAQKGFILSISDGHDYHQHIELHMTVKPQTWWIEKLSKFGKITEYGEVPVTKQPYIIVRK